ncbi:MAG: TIGR00282 family metallophosphoesterase [Deltaproteobacteria bacterium]|nr:TIGR00282 family metallophosphoesterase [Deltaproteobacteria bacterium]
MPSSQPITILTLGDVVGKPGRKALIQHLDSIVEESQADFVIVNGENASGGLGITPPVAEELLALKIDVLTSGNHIWKHKDILAYLDSEYRLLRPANYPEGTPGRGFEIFSQTNGVNIGVINLEGQLFMNPLPCPFRKADAILEELSQKTSLIIVDFHAEATSEKRALGHYLDGRVTAVVGTHTHIPTADAEVLPAGTGYLTDLGMTGPTDSVIGVRKQQAIARFTTRLPSSFQVARGRVQVQGAIIKADPDTGKCLEMTQRCWPVEI